MARVKNGAVTKARHKKVLKQAKGYFGSKHRLYKTAKEQLMHSGQYAFRDRKQKKRDFRKLWITSSDTGWEISWLSFNVSLGISCGVTSISSLLALSSISCFTLSSWTAIVVMAVRETISWKIKTCISQRFPIISTMVFPILSLGMGMNFGKTGGWNRSLRSTATYSGWWPVFMNRAGFTCFMEITTWKNIPVITVPKSAPLFSVRIPSVSVPCFQTLFFTKGSFSKIHLPGILSI